jgi:hypothetical protein
MEPIVLLGVQAITDLMKFSASRSLSPPSSISQGFPRQPATSMNLSQMLSEQRTYQSQWFAASQPLHPSFAQERLWRNELTARIRTTSV